MDLEEFRSHHEVQRRQSPKVFLLVESDTLATPDRIQALETEIGLRLPERYKQFLMEFGGGIFGLTNVFSADAESGFYLPSRLDAVARYLPSGLVPFSDDYAGGFYVWRATPDRSIDEAVWYWNFDGGLVNTDYLSLLDFLAAHAYDCSRSC